MKMLTVLLTFFLFIEYASSQYPVTLNGCFYELGSYIDLTAGLGNEITRIKLYNSDVGVRLATCCSYCSALTDEYKCLVWQLYGLTDCILYRNVTTPIYTGVGGNYYVGKIGRLPYWKCNEESNRWYFDSNLIWVTQTSANAILNKTTCCEACFKAGTCASWQYSDTTKNCYHSTKSHVGTVSTNLTGMHTGFVSRSFNDTSARDFSSNCFE